jgi:exo-beta-1,3-glucanase (GH17 family)
MPTTLLPYLRGALILLFATVLSACGGGGVVTVDAPATAVSTTALRALPAEYLARKAVSYSPFRSNNRDTETITEAMVKEDLDLLVAGDFRLIRLFDSSDKVAKLTLETIVKYDLDIKVQLGAYVNSFKYEANPYKVIDIKAANDDELRRLIDLANDLRYSEIILAVSVGNETMVEWSIVPIDQADMATYIRYVRDRVTQPVTTDDNFLFFIQAPKVVMDLLDFVAMHTYASIDTQFPASPYYWDWKQQAVAAGPARATAMMDAAMVATRHQFQLVRDSLDRKGLRALPIAVTETGWNAEDQGAQRFRAHPVNQKMYFTRLETWRAEGRVGPGPTNIFYFEAFDEPWKAGDDKWGLFNVNRKARYVLHNLYPQSLWENAALTDADAVYFIPPVINAPFAGNQFTLYSDAPGAVVATGLSLDAFDGNTAARNLTDATAMAPEGAVSMAVTPAPRDYGWGLLYNPLTAGTTVNLSQFAATGRVNFSVRTSYPGKIEIGLSTLTTDGNTQEVFLQIGVGEYGYCNNDSWCQVSIPLQAFAAKNPNVDFRLVLSPFYIADRYSFTGKALNSNITTKLNIDGIHYSR